MKRKDIILLGVSVIAGYILGIMSFIKLLFKRNSSFSKKNERLNTYYNLLNQWLDLRQSGVTVDEYFTNNHYRRIAIYGLGELGERLYNELKESEVTISCAIDKNVETTCLELPVLYPKDCPQDIDVIVVTPTFAFREIANELSEYTSCPIISLEDVVFGL